MKLVDKLRDELVGEIFMQEELDRIMEENRFFPVEIDSEEEEAENILKYTNNKSQIWIKYVQDDTEYLVENVTRATKKNGATKVRAFKTMEEISGMMAYFRDNEKYDALLIFVLGCLLARRVGDTLSLKWSDFYYENGVKKEVLSTLVESKTDKIVKIRISNITWDYIDWYCNLRNINPIEHLKEDIFLTTKKIEALSCKSPTERKEKYKDAVKRLAASYRYTFQQAADFNQIVGVSTHSTRKTFGYLAYQINRFDPDCMMTLQSIFGHDSVETTKIYIDTIDDKAEKYFNDVARSLFDADNGVIQPIDNIPVVALKTNDLREILIQAYKYGQDINLGEMETLNQLLYLVEEKRIS